MVYFSRISFSSALRSLYQLPFAETMRSLVLIHFLVPAARVRPHLPPGLELATHQTATGDVAFVALVCYRAVGFRPALLPSEQVGLRIEGINYRTYVRDAAGPAVYFFGVTTHQVVPWLASRLFGAPTRRAPATFGDDWERGRLQVASQHPWPVLLDAVEHVEKPLSFAPFGSAPELLRALTDPLRGYMQRGRQVYRFDVTHPPLETVATGEVRAIHVGRLEQLGILRGEQPHSLISARNIRFRLGLHLGMMADGS